MQLIKRTGLILAALLCSNFGHAEVKSYQLEPFKSIDISGSFDVDFTQAQSQSVRILGEKEAFEQVEVKVKDGILYIESNAFSFWNTCPKKCKIKAEIMAPRITDITISGSAQLTARDLDLASLHLQVSGSIDAKLSGKTKELGIDASGSSKVDASELIASDVTIDASGSVDTDIHTTKSLNVDISGSGKVRYRGQPSRVDTSIAGAAQVSYDQANAVF